MRFLYFSEQENNADDFIDSRKIFRWRHFSCKCPKHIKYSGYGNNKSSIMFRDACKINLSLINGLNNLALLLRRQFGSDKRIEIKNAYKCERQSSPNNGIMDKRVVQSNFHKGMAAEIKVKGVDLFEVYNLALVVPQFSNHCVGVDTLKSTIFVDVDFSLPERRRFII